MNKLPRLSRSELYTERMRAIEFFSRTNDIDLYGVDWDKASRRMGRSRIPGLRRAQIAISDWVDTIRPDPLLVAARKVFKGELETKWETLARYDFALCFENAYIKGYLTEKLFECLRVGTIPIYWGATDIEELVSPDCFIDMRRFADYSELLRILKSTRPGSGPSIPRSRTCVPRIKSIQSVQQGALCGHLQGPARAGCRRTPDDLTCTPSSHELVRFR